MVYSKLIVMPIYYLLFNKIVYGQLYIKIVVVIYFSIFLENLNNISLSNSSLNSIYIINTWIIQTMS